METVITPVTDEQKKQVKWFAEDTVDCETAKLNEAHVQRLIERGGEMQDGIAKLIAKLSVSNRYAKEEVQSSYGYLSDYKPKPIADQIKIIATAKIFGLDPSQALEFAKNLPALESFVPANALKWTGWFAIPSVDALAKKHFPKVTNPAQKYCHAVQLVHAKIADSELLCNCCVEKITPAHLRVHSLTAHALDLIAETQKGDILIIATQLGMLHGGKSVRRAREVFAVNEFGLGSLAVDSIILTHLERPMHYNDLYIDCAGDEYARWGDGDFWYAPISHFGGDRVKFDVRCFSDAYSYFGSASAFLSQ